MLFEQKRTVLLFNQRGLIYMETRCCWKCLYLKKNGKQKFAVFMQYVDTETKHTLL